MIKIKRVVFFVAAASSAVLAACGGGSPPSAPVLARPQLSALTGDRASAASGQTSYTITDLGTLGGTISSANVVNNRGVAVGLSTIFGDMVYRGFVSNNGVLTDLGALPSGPDSLGNDVNDRLQVVGEADASTSRSDSNATCWGDNPLTRLVTHAVVWQGGAITDIGTLGGAQSVASHINSRGQISGASQIAAPDPNGFVACGGKPGAQIVRAFIYEGGRMRDIGTLGGYDAFGNPINDRGQISGGADVTTSVNPATGYPPHHPFLWTNGVMSDLGTLGGGFGFGEAINNYGVVVGMTTLAGEQHAHAFRWKNGVMSDLGVLNGDTDSAAGGINDAEVIVGVSFTSSTSRGFIVRSGVMTDLNTLISPAAGYTVAVANSVNDRGQISAQAVVKRTGDLHAIILTPMNNGIRGIGDTAPLGKKLRAYLLNKYGFARLKVLNSAH